MSPYGGVNLKKTKLLVPSCYQAGLQCFFSPFVKAVSPKLEFPLSSVYVTGANYHTAPAGLWRGLESLSCSGSFPFLIPSLQDSYIIVTMAPNFWITLSCICHSFITSVILHFFPLQFPLAIVLCPPLACEHRLEACLCSTIDTSLSECHVHFIRCPFSPFNHMWLMIKWI